MKFVGISVKKCMFAFSVSTILILSMAQTQSFAQEITVAQETSEAEPQSFGYCFKCNYYCGLHGTPLVYSCEYVCRYDWFMDCD